MSASAASARAFDPAPLLRLLDGPYAELRQQIRDVLCRPEFAPVIALPTGEYRERVLEWAKQLAHEGIAAPGFPAEYGGQDDFGANVAAFETLGFGDLHQGVRIEDSGEKMGMNGVDNGRIWFDQVRVPREALLNRYGEVDEQGDYTSPIENANQRFFTMLGTLVQGRVCVSGASISAERDHDRHALRAAPSPVRAGGRRTRPDPRVPHPAAPADAAAGHLRAELRPGRARPPVSRGVQRG